MQSIKLLVFLSLTLMAATLKGQQGYFFINHFSPDQHGFDNINFDLIQDDNGVIYVANRNGIVHFDGKNWDIVKTSSTVFSLSMDSKSNRIFSTGRNGFGQVEWDTKQGLGHKSLAPRSTEGSSIFSSVYHRNKLYGINQESLFILEPSDTLVNQIMPKYGGSLTGLFVIGDEIYVNNTVSGLLRLHGNVLDEPEKSALQGLSPAFVCPSGDSTKWIIGMETGEINLFNGDSLTMIDTGADRQYFENSEVLSGVWISDDLVAVATLKGGVIFLNPETGKVDQIINYQSGLPDNEVFSILLDRDDALWISHKEGLTRVSPNLPFRSFNRYAGLEGDLLSVIHHKDTLYVGTTLGLYYLAEVKDYDETTYVVKSYITEEVRDEQQVVAPEEEPEPSGGILKFLRRNKRNRQDQKTPPDSAQVRPRTRTRVRYEKKTKKELLSTRYEFRKIDSIDSKVFHLTSVSGRLFCGGLDGLYEVEHGKAKNISNTPVRYFFVSTYHKKIFVSNYQDLIRVYSMDNLLEVYMFGEFKSYVDYIFEGSNGKIWFCGSSEIFWVEIKAGDITETETYPLDNPYFYETLGATRGDSLVFINETGILSLDLKKDKIVPLSSAAGLKRYLSGSDGQVWFLKNKKWRKLDSTGDSERLDQLSLFKNVGFISSDSHGNLWVITEKNELFRLSSDNVLPDFSDQLMLRKIKTEASDILSPDKFKVLQDHSSLVFEFIQPDYSGILDIEYQYRLLGLNSAWSNWSEKYNVIDFAYLPEGDYELNVRSRNTLGSISEIQKVPFKVVAPYWKRPWFYALEFCALALFLLIYSRLKKLGYRNRLASRIVALLTLIIIIEFIQTIAENEFQTHSSPIFDFAIQVTVAVIILPVEGLLRKYIFKEKNVQLLDFLRIRNQSSIDNEK